jgi:hypothetical protein
MRRGNAPRVYRFSPLGGSVPPSAKSALWRQKLSTAENYEKGAGEMNNKSSENTAAMQVTGTNGFAVAALVTGILSLVFFWGGWLFAATSALAIFAGVRGGRVAVLGKGQRGLATAGLVLGILAAVLEFVMLCSVGRP